MIDKLYLVDESRKETNWSRRLSMHDSSPGSERVEIIQHQKQLDAANVCELRHQGIIIYLITHHLQDEPDVKLNSRSVTLPRNYFASRARNRRASFICIILLPPKLSVKKCVQKARKVADPNVLAPTHSVRCCLSTPVNAMK